MGTISVGNVTRLSSEPLAQICLLYWMLPLSSRVCSNYYFNFVLAERHFEGSTSFGGLFRSPDFWLRASQHTWRTYWFSPKPSSVRHLPYCLRDPCYVSSAHLCLLGWGACIEGKVYKGQSQHIQTNIAWYLCQACLTGCRIKVKN